MPEYGACMEIGEVKLDASCIVIELCAIGA